MDKTSSNGNVAKDRQTAAQDKELSEICDVILAADGLNSMGRSGSEVHSVSSLAPPIPSPSLHDLPRLPLFSSPFIANDNPVVISSENANKVHKTDYFVTAIEKLISNDADDRSAALPPLPSLTSFSPLSHSPPSSPIQPLLHYVHSSPPPFAAADPNPNDDTSNGQKDKASEFDNNQGDNTLIQGCAGANKDTNTAQLSTPKKRKQPEEEYASSSVQKWVLIGNYWNGYLIVVSILADKLGSGLEGEDLLNELMVMSVKDIEEYLKGKKLLIRSCDVVYEMTKKRKKKKKKKRPECRNVYNGKPRGDFARDCGKVWHLLPSENRERFKSVVAKYRQAS